MKRINRRQFLYCSAAFLSAAMPSGLFRIKPRRHPVRRISGERFLRVTRRTSCGNGLMTVNLDPIEKKPLLELCKVLHAANIDLKSIDDAIYRKLNGGYLKPVLRTLTTLHEQEIHFEIATLVIPGYVDDPEMLKQMCGMKKISLLPM